MSHDDEAPEMRAVHSDDADAAVLEQNIRALTQIELEARAQNNYFFSLFRALTEADLDQLPPEDVASELLCLKTLVNYTGAIASYCESRREVMLEQQASNAPKH